jgi:methionyl-tRNA formyltransferase
MAEAGAALVLDSLRKLERGEISPIAQDGSQASYAPKLEKEHGRIDWAAPAWEIYNRMRGMTPWPGAYTTFRGQSVHIWGRAAAAALGAGATSEVTGSVIASEGAVYVVCGDGSCLSLEAVQIEGRKRITAREFMNGARLAPGERFGALE